MPTNFMDLEIETIDIIIQSFESKTASRYMKILDLNFHILESLLNIYQLTLGRKQLIYSVLSSILVRLAQDLDKMG